LQLKNENYFADRVRGVSGRRQKTVFERFDNVGVHVLSHTKAHRKIFLCECSVREEKSPAAKKKALLSVHTAVPQLK
jgi:hypothetical protein